LKKKPLLILSAIVWFTCTSWGFFAHQDINRMAVFILPSDMIRFYKNNILYLTEHAVDADKRRYSDSLEAPRHFIDADRYGKNPFDSIPERWVDAENKYSEKRLKENGIVPWQIERTYYSLVRAFKERDSIRILRHSADLGHYVSDAHVPLHTTENYNGQLSKQTGIHGFWESRLPELFSTEYDFITGPAKYIKNPLKEAWKIIRSSHGLLDSTLLIEARLNKTMASDLKFSFSERKDKVERQYSKEYARAYHSELKGMVENQMRASVLMTGSYWLSAWVDAGQPKLRDFPSQELSQEEKLLGQEAENSFGKGRIIGRPEN
jgi:hypothetical protein